MLGRAPAEAEGVLLVELLAGNAWESGLFPTELHELADHLKRRESFSNIVLPVELDGKVRWWELSASPRSEEHTSELQSLMRISYAVFCLKKKKNLSIHPHHMQR